MALPAALLALAPAVISAIGNIIGGREDRDAAADANAQNAALQREFAQSGLSWRVRDAVRAGLHPLAALGASVPGATPSFQPVGSGDTWRSMGQDLSRAVSATSTSVQREMDALTLERGGLENELLRLRIARESSAQVGPGLPGEELREAQHNMSAPGSPSVEAGAVNDLSFVRLPDGSMAIAPSSDVKNRIEDNEIQEAAWALRNNVFGGRAPGPELFTVKGQTGWKWSVLKQRWEPYTGPLGPERPWWMLRERHHARRSR